MVGAVRTVVGHQAFALKSHELDKPMRHRKIFSDTGLQPHQVVLLDYLVHMPAQRFDHLELVVLDLVARYQPGFTHTWPDLEYAAGNDQVTVIDEREAPVFALHVLDPPPLEELVVGCG